MYFLKKLTNSLLKKGQKQFSENTLLKALSNIKIKQKKSLSLILKIIELNCSSSIELRFTNNRRRRRQFPAYVKFKRRRRITSKNLIKFAMKQYPSRLNEKIFVEFSEAFLNSKKSLTISNKKIVYDFSKDNLPLIRKIVKKKGRKKKRNLNYY